MRELPVKAINPKSQIPILNVQNYKFMFWSVVIICNLVLGAWNFIYAAPCYGTKIPEKHKFFVGAQNHAIFKRYLENEQGKLRSMQNFLLISYGAYDWLSIDLKGGAGNIKQHPLGSDEIDYASGFNGGYGFRVRLYDKDKIKAVFGFQHISVHPKSARVASGRNKAILDDWQFSSLVSYDFSRKSGIPPSIKQWAGKRITPYLGAKWSRVDYIHTLGDTRKRVMSDLTKSIGAVFGLDIPLSEKIWINLEGQVIDGEAFSFSANYKF